MQAGLAAAITSSESFLENIAINSLIPPPRTPTPKQETTPHSYTVSGTANAAAPFSPIPKIYGQRRIFPQYAASPYNELVGFDQYLRMLFLFGHGPLDISQIKLGDTAIEDYEDVEWELRSGFPDDAPTRLYPGSVSEAELNIQLSKTNGGGIAPTVYDWSQVPVQTSGTNADELGVDVSFPGGLSAFAKSSGEPVFIGCRLQIRWAPAGTQNWTYEPVFVIKSTYIGTTGAGHVWRVPRGQYDVQATLSPFTVLGDDWSQNYVADGYWTALRTIRDQPPYSMAGLALLAVRIRASRQLSGAISNLNCVAASILPDYDSTTGLWDGRAGGWSYDYDNQGAGASLYGLDAANVHSTAATTDKEFIADFVIGTGDGSTVAFANTLPAPPAQGALSYAIQPGSLIVSVGTQASVSDSPGSKKLTAAVASLLFIGDDGEGNIVGPTVAGGTVDYTTGALSLTFTVAPPSGLNVTADFTLLVQTAGGGRALAIQTASSSDQAAIASKSIPVRILPPDGSTGTPPPTSYAVSGWYMASAALTAGVTIRVFWGDAEDFAVADAIGYYDILAAGDATTAWQQASGTATAPSGAGAPLWMRIAVYHLGAGSGVTVYLDDFAVTPAEQGVTAFNVLGNPSFDFAGQITTNPASHYRDVLQSRANKLAVADARLDLTGLQNWWIDNNTNNRNFNGVLDSPGTVFDTLRKIVSFGRASFTMRDSLYSVVVDQPQTTPIQHFTPRNSWGFKWTKGFPNLPQALKVRFLNPDNNWQVDERVVYDDNPAGGTYDAASTSLYEVLDLSDGCTDYVQAWKDGRYHLAQARLRGETFEWHADIENIVCQHGDLVYLTHDVPEFGRGAGRIASVQLDGSGNCTGITTDELFTFDYGSSYVARIRRSLDGTSLLENLTNPAAELGGTVSSTASGVWALASLVITGEDGPPALRAAVLGPTGTSTSAAVTMPSGMEAGDLIVVQLTFQGEPGTISPPAGWGLLLLQSDGADNTVLVAILYKLANDAEPSSYAFAWQNSVVYQSGAAAFSNVAGDNPIESSSAAGALAADSAATPVVAPQEPLNALVAVFVIQNGSGTLTLTDATQLWAPATGLGAWYYAPSSIATGALVFQTPIPAASPQPAAGDLVMFGILNAETNPVVITRIEPGSELSARITAVDYAPAIYNSDSGTPPNWNSQGQAAPTRPVPQFLATNSSDFVSVRDADGSLEARIMIALKPPATMLPDAGSIVGIEYETQTSSTVGLNDRGAYSASDTYNTGDAVTYSGQIWVALADGVTNVEPGTNSGDWTALVAQSLNNRGAYDSSATYNISDLVEYNGEFWIALANGVTGVAPGSNANDWMVDNEATPWTQPALAPAATTVIIAGVNPNFAYNIRLRYVFSDGSRGGWSSLTHVVAGQVSVPLDVTNLTATPVTLKAVKLKWTRSVSPNIREYEIRQGASWASAAVIANVRTTHFQDHDLALGAYTFWVGTIDTSGNYSASPPSVTVTIAAPQGSSTLDDLADGSARAALAASGVGNGKVIEGGLAAGAATGGAQAAWSGSQSWGASFFGPFQNGAAITTSGSGAASWQTLADLDYSAAVQLQADAGASLEATVTLIAPKYERTGGDVIVTLVVLDNVPAGIAVAAELDVSGTLAWSANYYWGSLPSGMPGGSNSNQGALPSITPGVPFTLTIPRAFGYTCEKVAFGVVAPSGAISTVGFLNLFSTQDGAAGSYHAFNEWFSALQLPLSVLDAGDLVNLYALISANAANMASSDSLAARIIDENGDVIVAPQTVLSINGSTATSNVSATNSPFHGAPAAPTAGNHTYTLQFSTGGGSGGNSASATFTAASAWGWDARA